MSGAGPKKRLPDLKRINGGSNGFLNTSKDGSPLKHGLGSPKRPSSPEPNCSICLGGIEEKSFANKCFHSFCRTCLFEWSKVKAECPVCRQAFDRIIFNVKAMDDYEESIVAPTFPGNPLSFLNNMAHVEALINQPTRWEHSGLASNINIFRRRVLQLQHMLNPGRTRGAVTRSMPISLVISQPPGNPGQPPRAHESSNRSSTSRHLVNSTLRSVSTQANRDNQCYIPPVGTCAHRRYIYEKDLWVQPLTGRMERESSATFYRNNPAVTHRLVPFLNRELLAILTTSFDCEHLIARINQAIFEHDIPSVSFRRIVEPYTQDKTHHFLHELYYFAKSPYNMEDYNSHAVYAPKANVTPLTLEANPAPRIFVSYNGDNSDSSTDDSVIEVVESDDDLPLPIDPPAQTATAAVEVLPRNSDQDELNKAIKSVQKASKEMDSQVLAAATPQNVNMIDDFDNPTPGPSGLCRSNVTNGPVNNPQAIMENDDGSDTEIDIGTSQQASTTPELGYGSGSESDDSIRIVGFRKPIHERTPELIDISSSDGSVKESDVEIKPSRKKHKTNAIDSCKEEKMSESDSSCDEKHHRKNKDKKRKKRKLSSRKKQKSSLDMRIKSPSRKYSSSSDADSMSDSESDIKVRRHRVLMSVIVTPNISTPTVFHCKLKKPQENDEDSNNDEDIL